MSLCLLTASINGLWKIAFSLAMGSAIDCTTIHQRATLCLRESICDFDSCSPVHTFDSSEVVVRQSDSVEACSTTIGLSLPLENCCGTGSSEIQQ